jgi:single-stranded-DNA-specific exonuclease
LVNPHVHGDEGNEALRFCTVGLVFKLAYGIVKLRREQKDQRAFDIVLREYLDLVSMGTIADLVPLIHENRTLTRIGLNALGKTKRMGLKSLMSVAGMNASHGVKPVDISFKIAPRINASGRLADAALAVELLLSDDASYSMELSLKLDSFNRERQEIEKKIAQEAMAQVEAGQSNNSGLVVYGDDWHPGVVGIVASRVSRAYGRPCIVLGREGKLAKGSGRSIDGVNLVDVLNNFSDEMEAWGGHPMAVGVSIDKEKVERLRQHFDQGVKAFMESHIWEKTIEISTFLKLEDINSDLMDEIDLLQPFGQANREPIFGSKQVVFRQRPKVFKDVHFRFALEDRKGRLIQGVAWKMADRIPDLNTPVDIAYRLAWNSFGRQKVLQIDLVEWKAS